MDSEDQKKGTSQAGGWGSFCAKLVKLPPLIQGVLGFFALMLIGGILAGTLSLLGVSISDEISTEGKAIFFMASLAILIILWRWIVGVAERSDR